MLVAAFGWRQRLRLSLWSTLVQASAATALQGCAVHEPSLNTYVALNGEVPGWRICKEEESTCTAPEAPAPHPRGLASCLW